MKRFASIDFLRGLAIFVMLILHTSMDSLDLNDYLDRLGSLSLLEGAAFIVLPYLGGAAGFFLMLSAMGNMFSMTRHLERGGTVRDLIVKQTVGGAVLLLFGMLSEGVIGYHGALGNLFQIRGPLSTWHWQVCLSRIYHFETIHTIAWCLILNGLVHGLLSRRQRWRNPGRQIRNYAILSFIVLALTPLMWRWVDRLMPGYPYAPGAYPILGKDPFGKHAMVFFLSPLAGFPEPVFPYLAASFIGSILGIQLWSSKLSGNVETHNKPKQRFPYVSAKVGLCLFLIGSAGLLVNLYFVLSKDVDAFIGLYRILFDHRYWTADHGVPYAGWLFQFLSLNGASMCWILLVVKLVEFRGKAAVLGKRTAWMRRFGFVAFTVYTIQWIYFLCHRFVSHLLGVPYGLHNLRWGPVLLTAGLALLSFHLLLLAWERIRYIGSLEYWMGTLLAALVPAKRRALKREGTSWWQWGLLDARNVFYEVNWLNCAASPLNVWTKRIAVVGFLLFAFAVGISPFLTLKDVGLEALFAR